MHLSASAAAWIAIAAAVAAVVALAVAVGSYLALRRVRTAQRVLLDATAGGAGDLVDFAVSLQARIDDLHRAVDGLRAHVGEVDRRMDGAVARTGIVRYDAYGNAGGHQSASVALLDSSSTGVVLSAIQGRDYARIYVKELDRGRAAVPLSPEEQDAVSRAQSSRS